MSEVFDRLAAALADRYTIERELGQGGMATVFLAHDRRHDRRVALKVLRPELAAVLGAERFVVEIRTTAGLQHPHILPLFDSGSADGFLFYVMPYIAGETLRAKLDRETQLGVGEAVKLAVDVGDALDYAHRQGVIHRDIKPENILLHGGRPVVADFGIALAVSAAAAGGGRMTETGLSLGTPHYMSPEQATAEKELTGRSDIYSLASVLYEMLTGTPPHTGASAQQIIMKIVTEDAAPVTTLRRSVPPHVAAAVAKALEKLPADRFETAAQFAAALANPAFVHGAAAPSLRLRGRRALPWRAVGTAAVALLAMAAAWGWRRDPGALALPGMRLLIDFPDGRAPIFQPGGAFALSPDGSRIAYMGGGRRSGGSDTWRLWIRPLDRVSVDSVPGSEQGHSPAWSPGGDSLVFAVGGELRVFSTLPGGGVATIRRGAELGYGLSWSHDGGILFIADDELRRIAPAGGAEETVVRRTDHGSTYSWPYWVEGGSAATLTSYERGSQKARVLLTRIGGGARLDTLADGFNGQPLPGGELLWSDASGTIYTAPLDVKRGRLSGGRTQLLAGVLTEPGMELRLSVSRDGAIVYALASAVQARSRVTLVDRQSGERVVLPSPPGVRLFPDLRLSPDGGRLAGSGARGVSHEIWLYQLATSEAEAFTVDGISYRMVWSPDGDRLSYCADFPSDAIFSRPADKRAPATRLARRTGCPRSSTPDGAMLLLDAGESGLETLTPPDTVARPLPGAGEGEFAGTVSPDGRWLAYAATKGGSTDVWVRGFRSPGGPWQVSRGGGFDPVWSRDGRALYLRTDSAIVAAAVSPGSSFRAGAPQRVTGAASSVSAIYSQSFDVFPDGRRLVLFESGSGASVEHLILETKPLARPRAP